MDVTVIGAGQAGLAVSYLLTQERIRHTVSYQSLARDGVTLLGRLVDIDGYNLKLKPDLMECIMFADEKSSAFKDAIDAFIQREGVDAPPPEPDPGEPALPDLSGSDLIDNLDLRDAGISSVIWRTGFDADWSWLKAKGFDGFGQPQQRNGISKTPGLTSSVFRGCPNARAEPCTALRRTPKESSNTSRIFCALRPHN